MLRLQKKLLAVGLAFAYTFVSSADAFAGFSTPAPFQSGIFIQPSQASKYAQQKTIKGVQFYAEFENIPDYASYANMPPINSISYDTVYSDFFYIDNARQYYNYSSKVYDYYDVKPGSFRDYKQYLKDLGFTVSRNLNALLKVGAKIENGLENLEEYQANPQYIELIKKDILHDPDFKAEPNGVYAIDTSSGYSVVVFGESVNYFGSTRLKPCNEIRVYNLYCDYGMIGNVNSFVASFSTTPDNRPVHAYVSESGAYVEMDMPSLDNYLLTPGNETASFADRLIQAMGISTR